MNFELLIQKYRQVGLLNDGHFSRVDLWKNIRNKFAKKLVLKTYNKQVNQELNILKYIFIENKALIMLQSSEFVVKLVFSAQDTDSYYFGLEYCSNGNLQDFLSDFYHENFVNNENYQLIKDMYLLGIRQALSQILVALEALFKHGIIHRDLKPDNILLDDKCNIKLCDFGSAKLNDPHLKFHSFGPKSLQKSSSYHEKGLNDKLHDMDYKCLKAKSYDDMKKLLHDSDQKHFVQTYTNPLGSLVGTPNFMSPEILFQKPHIEYTSDLWSYGNLAYLVFFNEYYFDGTQINEVFKKIKTFNGFERKKSSNINTVNAALDLISRLIVWEPNRRLGSEQEGGYARIKRHEFFNEINWKLLHLSETSLKYFFINKNKLFKK